MCAPHRHIRIVVLWWCSINEPPAPFAHKKVDDLPDLTSMANLQFENGFALELFSSDVKAISLGRHIVAFSVAIRAKFNSHNRVYGGIASDEF